MFLIRQRFKKSWWHFTDMDTEGSGARDLLPTHEIVSGPESFQSSVSLSNQYFLAPGRNCSIFPFRKAGLFFPYQAWRKNKNKNKGQSINVKNIRAHLFPSRRQWGFESHSTERQVRGAGTAQGLEKGHRSELRWGTFRSWWTRLGGGALILRAEWQGQPHLLSPFLAIASLARKSNLSSLIRVEQSEQWAPSSKLTAQLNRVEEPGWDVCFVCLELVPSNGSFPNSNAKQLKLDSSLLHQRSSGPCAF